MAHLRNLKEAGPWQLQEHPDVEVGVHPHVVTSQMIGYGYGSTMELNESRFVNVIDSASSEDSPLDVLRHNDSIFSKSC